jgi:hypothetical protein
VSLRAPRPARLICIKRGLDPKALNKSKTLRWLASV